MGLGYRFAAHRKKKYRVREIEFERVERIQEGMKMNDVQIAELLDISTQQYYNYRKSNSLPAPRYYGVKDALLLSLEDELRERRQQIMSLFS